MRHSLLLLCAGDASLHIRHRWATDPTRTYDVAIVYYGNDPAVARRYQSEADYYVRRPGPKWALVRHVLLTTRWWRRYDYVAFPDDDLALRVGQWNHLFALARTHKLDLCQPALVDNGPQYVKHAHLVVKPNTVLRHTTFVEIMAPVFSRRALLRSYRVLTDARIKSGWGIDYVLPQRVLPATHGYTVAVVDAVPMVHTKPLSVVDSAALASSFYTRFRIDPEAELRYFLRAYKARKQPPRVLREVPAPVDYRRRSRRLPSAVDSRRTRKSARASGGPVALGCGIRLPAYLQSNLDREMRPWEAADTPDSVARFDPATLPKYYSKVPLGFHARIRDNALTVVKDLGSFQSRNQSTVQMLHDVLAMYRVPDCEFLVCTDDKPAPPDVPTVPLFVMAKRASQRYLTYPDHTFYDWPEAQTGPWDVERHALRKADNARAKTTKTPAAMFRGNATTAYVRQHLVDTSPHRPELDVEDVRVGAGVGTVVPLHEHGQWKYLLHLPGISYAARLKYLLQTRSVVLYVRKRPEYEYREFWYDYLDQHPQSCVVVADTNRYHPVTGKRQKDPRTGKWDDRANHRIVRDIVRTVRTLEADAAAYARHVQANTAWRREFGYATVLGYWASLLRRYEGVMG